MLNEAMKCTQLIKASALVELGELHQQERAQGKPLTPIPRCQDWPSSKVASPAEIKAWENPTPPSSTGGGVVGLCVLVLSICWLDPEHPDKLCEQLMLLLPILKAYAAIGPYAVMWDFCSLPQKNGDGTDDRSEEQKATFKRSLQLINVWYAHRLTTCVLVTKLPDNDNHTYTNCTPYARRGWTTVERLLSYMVKSSDCLLELDHAVTLTMPDAAPLDVLKSIQKELKPCKRPPPLLPSEVNEMIARGVQIYQTTGGIDGIKFTAGGDQPIVCEQYEKGLRQQMAVAEGLHYGDLGWKDADISIFANTATQVTLSRLQRLRLHENSFGDTGARVLAHVIEQGKAFPALKKIHFLSDTLTAESEGAAVLRNACAKMGVEVHVLSQ